ncbi:hypothetical protein [Bradyrhizobium elkanii]|uniref:hypothetical protein n=1 Tax=Bradyrhizobium elkanii TaxID=29448 RepID=UPI003D192AB0
MAIDNNKSAKLRSQIEAEIRQYLTETVMIGKKAHSQHKLVERIAMFESKTYPNGKFDSQGNYKYWFDIQQSPIDGEVKNVDFNSRDVIIYSAIKNTVLQGIIANMKLGEWMRKTGQDEEINSGIEEGAGWGNVLWKKVRGEYERCNLRETYIINQTARTVNETAIIEHHQLTQSQVRAYDGTYDNVPEVLERLGTNQYKAEAGGQAKATTVPFYNFYERNGEVCVADLKEANGEKPTKADENRYVLARVIGAGTISETSGVNIELIVFAEELPGMTMEDIYKEYHRGRYKGRWFREGLYELTFDLQVRANQIGNQIAVGLEYASKTWFTSEDQLIYQNIMTDMANGDIIRTKGVHQIEVRMQGFDQLVADWNRIIQLRNEICNSMEIVQGEQLSPNTPLGLGQLYDANANKLFVFIRQKFAIPYSCIFNEWIIPKYISYMRTQDIVELSGDADMLSRFAQLIVADWYNQNLIAFGPHDEVAAQGIKDQQLQKLLARKKLLVEGIKRLFAAYVAHAYVDITGVSMNLNSDIETLKTFAQLEADPVRRSAIIEQMAWRKGLDFSSLPKSEPQQASTIQATPLQKPALAGAEQQ